MDSFLDAMLMHEVLRSEEHTASAVHEESNGICEEAKYWEQPARATYMETYKCHFNAKTACFAIGKLENRNKSTHKWTCEEVMSALKPLGVVLTSQNKHDAHYVANMLYSDYFDGVMFTEAHILKMTAYTMGDLDAKPTDIYTKWEAQMMNHCVTIDYAHML